MVHMLQNYDVFLQFCVSKRNQRNMVFIVHAAFESLKAFHSDILPPKISDAPNNHFNYKQIHSIKSEWSLTYCSHGLYPRQLPMFHSLCFKQCAFFQKQRSGHNPLLTDCGFHPVDAVVVSLGTCLGSMTSERCQCVRIHPHIHFDCVRESAVRTRSAGQVQEVCLAEVCSMFVSKRPHDRGSCSDPGAVAESNLAWRDSTGCTPPLAFLQTSNGTTED